MQTGLAPTGIRDALDRYERPLLRFASTIVGKDTAADVVQDVFLELVREPWEKVEGHLAAWLFTVCRNKAISHRRKSARHTDLEEDVVPEELDRGPDRALEKKEAGARIAKAMATLSERDREIVALKFAGGLSYKEIADVTKLSVSHVGVILHEALKKVRERVGQAERVQGMQRRTV
ncbi:MAG: sigma-70 family RNA polymerase sigma factor [Polyangiaceae bacterium]